MTRTRERRPFRCRPGQICILSRHPRMERKISFDILASRALKNTPEARRAILRSLRHSFSTHFPPISCALKNGVSQRVSQQFLTDCSFPHLFQAGSFQLPLPSLLLADIRRTFHSKPCCDAPLSYRRAANCSSISHPCINLPVLTHASPNVSIKLYRSTLFVRNPFPSIPSRHDMANRSGILNP